jgi:Bacterial nucleoid DNA-binding protein
MKLTKPEFIKAIATDLDLTQVFSKVLLEKVCDIICWFFEQGGESVRFGDCGTFKKVLRAERTTTTPQKDADGNPITVTTPAHYTVVFKPSPTLKAAVNGESAPGADESEEDEDS